MQELKNNGHSAVRITTQTSAKVGKGQQRSAKVGQLWVGGTI